MEKAIRLIKKVILLFIILVFFINLAKAKEPFTPDTPYAIINVNVSKVNNIYKAIYKIETNKLTNLTYYWESSYRGTNGTGVTFEVEYPLEFLTRKDNEFLDNVTVKFKKDGNDLGDASVFPFVIYSNELLNIPGGNNDFRKYYDPNNENCIKTTIEKLASNNSDLVDLVLLGNSKENIEINALKITNKSNTDPKISIVITGGIHSGEWIGIETALKTATYLTSGSQSPEIQNLLNKVVFWIVPLLNPDGYVYTSENNYFWSGIINGWYNSVIYDPSNDFIGVQYPDGRTWRGNRNFEDYLYGRDLNRNYNIQLSEKEILAIKNIETKIDIKDKKKIGFIDLHSAFPAIMPMGGISGDQALAEGIAAEIYDKFKEVNYITSQSISRASAPGNSVYWFYDNLNAKSICIEGRRGPEIPAGHRESHLILPIADIDKTCVEIFAGIEYFADWIISCPNPPENIRSYPELYWVNLKWDSSPGAISYNVYRLNSGIYEKINQSIITGNIYNDRNAIDGNTYYYKITAIDNNGRESALSNAVSCIPVKTPPVIICIKDQQGKIINDDGFTNSATITLKAQDIGAGIDKIVIRKNSIEGVPVANISFSAETNPINQSFDISAYSNGKYYVLVYDIVNIMSYSSQIINIDTNPPQKPKEFRATPKEIKIKLNWLNPSPEEAPDYYKTIIYRFTKDPNTLNYEEIQLISDKVEIYNDSGTNFTDTELTNGIVYYYVAFNYDLAGNYSEGVMVTGAPRRDIRVIAALNKLRSGDMNLMREGTNELVNLQVKEDESLVALIETAKNVNESEMVRIVSMVCLGKIGDSRAVGPIKEISQTTAYENIKLACTMVLGYFETGMARLSQVLNDDNENILVRLGAAGALGMLGDQSGYDIAVNASGNQDAFIRSRGLIALGYIGKEEGRQILTDALSDPRLKECVAVALKQLDLQKESASGVLGRGEPIGGGDLDIAFKISKFKEGLSDTSLAVREWAIKGLLLYLDRGNSEARTKLIEIAQNVNHISNRSVRIELDFRGIVY